VADIRFSFRLPISGWEEHRRISVNKSTIGPQGAEGIVFWTSFPDGDRADPCASVLSPITRRSTISRPQRRRHPGPSSRGDLQT
jgi:hypothetical protein